MIDKNSLTNLVKYVTLTRLHSLTHSFTHSLTHSLTHSIHYILAPSLVWDVKKYRHYDCCCSGDCLNIQSLVNQPFLDSQVASFFRSPMCSLNQATAACSSKRQWKPLLLLLILATSLTPMDCLFDDRCSCLGREIFIFWDPAFSLAWKFEGCKML